MLNRILASGLSWIWVAILIIILDRFLKMWMIANLSYLEPLKILPIFNFTLAYNTGAAFSFLHSASGWQNLVLGCLAVLISLVVFVWLYKLPRNEAWMSIALCLVLGGALGNAWDRVLYGHVIDFLDFHIGNWHFAIFNLADAGISIGAFLMIFHWLLYPKR